MLKFLGVLGASMKAGFRAEDAKNLTADCADLADRELKS
jgi:hypothetical protein